LKAELRIVVLGIFVSPGLTGIEKCTITFKCPIPNLARDGFVIVVVGIEGET